MAHSWKCKKTLQFCSGKATSFSDSNIETFIYWKARRIFGLITNKTFLHIARMFWTQNKNLPVYLCNGCRLSILYIINSSYFISQALLILTYCFIKTESIRSLILILIFLNLRKGYVLPKLAYLQAQKCSFLLNPS